MTLFLPEGNGVVRQTVVVAATRLSSILTHLVLTLWERLEEEKEEAVNKFNMERPFRGCSI